MPLWLESGRPPDPGARASPSTAVTRSARPSSSRMGSPRGRRRAGRRRWWTTHFWRAGTSSVVMTNSSPRSRCTGAVGEPADADLRALQVDEDGDGAAVALGGPADVVVPHLVLGVVAVAEVQPGDVHARPRPARPSLRGLGGGPEGADDLRSSHAATLADPRARPVLRPTPGCPTLTTRRRAAGAPGAGTRAATSRAHRRSCWRTTASCCCASGRRRPTGTSRASRP